MQHSGKPITVDYVEHIPPDVGAIKLWLTNRAPADWREKQEHEHNFGSSFADVIKATRPSKPEPRCSSS
jgi:hypothetical protein